MITQVITAFTTAVTTIELAGPTDGPGFRAAVRSLIHAGRAPEAVRFVVPACDPAPLSGLVDADLPLPLDTGDEASALYLPAGFAALCDTVLMHDDPMRFVRLYALAHTLHQRRAAWQDTLVPERVAVEQLAKAVRREIHKMHAFVRFRPLQNDGGITYVAWFEPAHHILHAVAPFFMRRFAGMRWAVLTPRGSLHWSGSELCVGPAAQRDLAPAADAGEALWLAYYRSIFNPARLNLAMMKREMPVRFWADLPEAHCIATLAAAASERTKVMVRGVATPRTRRRAQACDSQARGVVNPALQARNCDRCAFSAQATQMVWGEGAPGAALMLVGEQPGDREDLEGRPFVGPAGQLLRQAIAALGWPDSQLYLTNAVKHFKFEWRGKRRMHKTAAQREAAACADWLEAEISQIGPRAIVALGATAARSLLGQSVAVTEHAGQWLQRADGLPVLVLQHPAALLRAAPAAQAALHAAWRSRLADAARFLGQSSGRRCQTPLIGCTAATGGAGGACAAVAGSSPAADG